MAISQFLKITLNLELMAISQFLMAIFNSSNELMYKIAEIKYLEFGLVGKINGIQTRVGTGRSPSMYCNSGELYCFLKVFTANPRYKAPLG